MEIIPSPAAAAAAVNLVRGLGSREADVAETNSELFSISSHFEK